MIGKLTGTLGEAGADSALIEVGGVGYIVFCSRRTLAALGPVGSAAAVLVETHVREDHIHLYGFADAAEKAWFKLLVAVQGVGAKVALAVLSVLPPDDLATAIAAQDATALARADGVGPKLAKRIAAELRDKAPAATLAPAPGAGRAEGRPAAATAPEAGLRDDAVSALVNMGFGRSDAFAAVAAVLAEGQPAPADLGRVIPAALKRLTG